MLSTLTTMCWWDATLANSSAGDDRNENMDLGPQSWFIAASPRAWSALMASSLRSTSVASTSKRRSASRK
jgi:hypothetical protein